MVDQHHCVAGVLSKEGRVLLCHRRADRRWYPDVWDLPGGHVGPAESPAEALRRELAEEIGVLVVAPTGPPVAILTDASVGIELKIWIVDTWGGVVVNAAPDEHDAVAWFAPSELDELRLADDNYLDLLLQAVADATDT